MSDVCGRRRLAKLAFVTGASGNLRGFLEEPVHTNYNYRLTDPFAFHAAFLEERLRMQSSTDEVPAENTATPGSLDTTVKTGQVSDSEETNVPAVNAEGQNVPNAKTAEDFDALDLSKFVGPELLQALKPELAKRNQMKDFMDAWSKIEKNEQKKRIGERVKKDSVINKGGLEEITPMTEMKGKVDNLVERILGFEDAPKQAGLDEDESTLLYTDKNKNESAIFNVGKDVQGIVDTDNKNDTQRAALKKLMYKLMAAAILHVVDIHDPKSADGHGVWKLEAKESYEKGVPVPVESDKIEDAYAERQNDVVIEELRAIRDKEGGKIITGLRTKIPNEETLSKESVILALCKYLYQLTPLVAASANGEKSDEDALATAEKFFPNAFLNGIDLKVKLPSWEFKVGNKADTIFRIDLSKLGVEKPDATTGKNGDVTKEENGAVTKEKIEDVFKQKISRPEHQEVMNKLGEALKKEFEKHDELRIIEFGEGQFLTQVPAEPSSLQSGEAEKWKIAQDVVKHFMSERVMVKPHKATGVTDPVDFFTELSKSKSPTTPHPIVFFIGKLLSADFTATATSVADLQPTSPISAAGTVSPPE